MNNNIKVEIGQYRALDKGALVGVFQLVILPEGQKIVDCKHFRTNDHEWFSFPQKEIKYNDGRKSEYIPYISYLNKQYQQELKSAVVEALKKQTQGHAHETSARSENPVHAKPSARSQGVPF